VTTQDNLSVSVYQQFEVTARSFANSTAISEPDRHISFKELQTEAEVCATRLQALGISSGDRCIIFLPNSISTAVVLLAIWRVGGIPVLLNDQSPVTHLQHACKKTQSKLIVTARQISPFENDSNIYRVTDNKLPGMDVSATVVAHRSDETTVSNSLPDPASIIFTSGSSGLPKGVMQSHNTLINCCSNVASLLDLRRHDRILCPVPWSFDYGFGQLLSTLLLGITHVLPGSSNPFDVCQSIEKHQPTVLSGVPSLFANMVLGVSPIATTDVSSIKLVTSTGSAMSEVVFKKLSAIFIKARFSLNYGLTETYRSASLPVNLADKHPAAVGFAAPGVRIIILKQDKSEADVNEVGEIVHCGAGVFIGYWGDQSATQKVLRKLPESLQHRITDEPVVFTGDLGYRDKNGILYIKGRKDRQIKSMGVRVCPDEIEKCLTSHASITEAAVVASKHDIYGEIITAIVVLGSARVRKDSLPGLLRRHCKEKISAYMTPRRFICMKELPKTVSGKVDYVRLRKSIQPTVADRSLVSASAEVV